jgi:hypothetical protein
VIDPDPRRRVSPWTVYGGAALAVVAVVAFAVWFLWPRSSSPELSATEALYYLTALPGPLAFDDVPVGATPGADGVRAVCSPAADRQPPTAWVEYDVEPEAADGAVDELLGRLESAGWRTTDDEVADGVRAVHLDHRGEILGLTALTVEEDHVAVSVSLDFEDACYGTG